MSISGMRRSRRLAKERDEIKEGCIELNRIVGPRRHPEVALRRAAVREVSVSLPAHLVPRWEAVRLQRRRRVSSVEQADEGAVLWIKRADAAVEAKRRQRVELMLFEHG